MGARGFNPGSSRPGHDGQATLQDQDPAMHHKPSLAPHRIQAIITRLDAILTELDKADLGLAAVDIASAILKLEREGQRAPMVHKPALRSTA